jgi:hypothetical protein
MYCEYEEKDCPDSEFRVIPRLGLIHQVNVPLVHTVAGDEVRIGKSPPTDYDVPLPEPLVEFREGTRPIAGSKPKRS